MDVLATPDLGPAPVVLRRAVGDDLGRDRRPLAGALGAAVTGRLFALDWLHRGRSRRVVTLTEAGQIGLQKTFGLPGDWGGTVMSSRCPAHGLRAAASSG